jgi:hypothetical protein
MKPTTTKDRSASRLIVRLGWFIGIWGASVGVLACFAYALHKIILG